jgi:peptide-methionine (S)-S-oxide reductase
MRALARLSTAAALVGLLAASLAAAPSGTRPIPSAAGQPAPTMRGIAAAAGATDTAVFAGGCFWGVEAVFDHVKGVVSATSGYAGGSAPSPSYEEVSTGTTGHAESVRVIYDPAQVSYEQLLRIFFTVAHDPTQLNRQGPDVGTQYRSIVFYRNPAQHQAVERYIAKLGREHAYARPIVTQRLPLGAFYPAEAYHQDYLEHHPHQLYIIINDAPKLEQLRKDFPALYRDRAQA